MWENRCSLFYCPDITAEFEIFKIFKEVFAETSFASKIIDIFLLEFQVLEIFNNLFNASHNRISSAIRNPPEKHIKIRDFISHAISKISICHSNFIKISEHGQIFFCNHFFFLLFFIFKQFLHFKNTLNYTRLEHFLQEFTSVRSFHFNYIFRCSFSNYSTSTCPAIRPHINYMICSLNYIKVMFDYNYGIPCFN